MKCRYCGRELEPGKSLCDNRKCGMWNMPTTSATIDSATVLLSDAELGQVNRIETGLVDEVFGGGIVDTSVNLLGGEPGAGKTTLCLQLCDVIAGMHRDAGANRKEALFIANEQSDTEIKSTAERLELKHKDRIRIVKAMGGVPFDIGELILRYEPCFIVLDSVTKWSGEDAAEAVIICQRLKDYSVKLQAPSLVISQVVKSGDYAGRKEMQHAVDALFQFDIFGDADPQPDDPRRLETKKNRNGPAPVSQYFSMTSKGLVAMSEEDVVEKLKESDS